MLNITFKREPNYKENQYCVLEFKGKFQSETEDEQKNLVHLGQLKKISDDKYKLQIGIMDLIGEVSKLSSKQLVTETIKEDNSSRVILVKGIVTKRIVFASRPIPDMGRANTQKRQSGVNHKMFGNNKEQAITIQ